MKAVNISVISCISLLFILPVITAQQAKHVRCGECRQGPKFISQLPLEPTAVRLQFPAIFLETHGKWRAMNDQGKVIKYEGCVGYGPCVSYSKEESTSACAVGYINLALHLGLVKPGRYNLQWVPDNGDTVIGPISLIIQEPEGIDKEVYENILLPAWDNKFAKVDWEGWIEGAYQKEKPCIHTILLHKYPTSTYSAFLIYKRSGAEGMAKSEPLRVADAVTGKTALMGEIWVPSETTKNKSGMVPLSGKAAVEWRQKWFNIVLKNHPDIGFADDLRLKLAADQVALKNYQSGAMDLHALSKDATSNVAEHAKAILEAMEKKGFIKDQK